MEDTRLREKQKMQELQNKLYEKQRQMQCLQNDIEKLSSKNGVLE